MLQRPQTLLLGLIVILMLASLFLPNWAKTSADSQITAVQTAFELKVTTITNGAEKVDTRNRMYVAGMLILIAGLAGYSISQFSKRMNQLKIGFAITLSITLTLVAIMLGGKEGASFFEIAREGKYGYGFYCLFVALFANMISNRLIRRDEHLVRSMDRIR
jgi:hypothetical protein